MMKTISRRSIVLCCLPLIAVAIYAVYDEKEILGLIRGAKGGLK